MVIGIDLTARQTTRALEQARRQKARVELEPRNLPGGSVLFGILADRDGDLLTVVLDGSAEEFGADALIGAFCDIRTVMMGELYMFTTCVVETREVEGQLQIALAAPQAMQVANRRQFERKGVNQWIQVKLWGESFAGPHTAVLFNIGAGGMACRVVRSELEDALLIDDELIASFELPNGGEKFELPVVVCNKMPLDEHDYLVLGLEFRCAPTDTKTRQTIERLRTTLFQIPSDNPTEGDQ